jgi:hypothetical protein
MGRTCSTYGKEEEGVHYFGGKIGTKETTRRCRRGWIYTYCIQKNVKEIIGVV